jgi:hypothetical protein
MPPSLPERRLAPALHFITDVDVKTAYELRELAVTSHHKGGSLEQVCYHLTARSLALGYAASIAMQEVASRTMPSFPGEEVIAPILLLDLRPLRPTPAASRNSSR